MDDVVALVDGVATPVLSHEAPIGHARGLQLFDDVCKTPLPER
jgi:hypothetical protein